MVRVRFAPSPTGFLHVGGLRTALYNYLFARQKNGSFLLRIEDTDQTRLVPGAVEGLIQVLEKMGLNWDEGPKIGADGKLTQVGKFGPYVQSQRLEIYRKYADELVSKEHAYHCFCSAERLEKLRRTQELNKQPTMYDGLCRELDKKIVKQKLDSDEPHVIRLAVPREGVTKFNDIIHGEVEFANKLVDDQVLVKSDGFPTYHLANIIDDHLMEITHVIRGEEWLSSTPKHILMYQFFGWKAPQFAHVPLLLNPDKSKLSKRQGDVAAEDYLQKGYLKEALINFITLLGWNPGTEQEIFSLEELVKVFDLSRVQKAGAVLNLEKLNWMNGEYIKKLSLPKLVELSRPYLFSAGLITEKTDKAMLENVLSVARERLARLSDLPALVSYFFQAPEYDAKLLVWKKADVEITKARLERLIKHFEGWKGEWGRAELEEKTMAVIKDENLDNGATLWPMRAALSGLEKSPGPFDLAAVLGREETLKRLRTALKKIS